MVGVGVIAPLLLISQIILLYSLFPPFLGNGESEACGYMKLLGILPERGETYEVLAHKDSGGEAV